MLGSHGTLPMLGSQGTLPVLGSHGTLHMLGSHGTLHTNNWREGGFALPQFAGMVPQNGEDRTAGMGG